LYTWPGFSGGGGCTAAFVADDVLLPASPICSRTGRGRDPSLSASASTGSREIFASSELARPGLPRTAVRTTRQGSAQAAATSENQLHRPVHLRQLHPASPPTCATCGDRGVWRGSSAVASGRMRARACPAGSDKGAAAGGDVGKDDEGSAARVGL